MRWSRSLRLGRSACLCRRRARIRFTPAASATPPDPFAHTVVPLVAKYCGDCHSGAKAEAKLDLVHYKDAPSALHDRKVWRTVLGKLRSHEMPPSEADQPNDAERETVARWIDDELAKPVPYAAQDPGRVTIRRLNRAEYNNTIRDLVGVDFKPADNFPTDDVGYGFDNIGDVLSLPPLLMEKYLAAAEHIMDDAIVVPGPNLPKPTLTFEVGKMSFTGPRRASPARGARRLTKNGELFTNWKVHRAGEYKFQVRAGFRAPPAPKPPKMAIKFDGQELKSFDVRGDRTFGNLYDVTAHVERGNPNTNWPSHSPMNFTIRAKPIRASKIGRSW